MRKIILIVFALTILSCQRSSWNEITQNDIDSAQINAEQASEAWKRSQQYVDFWLDQADQKSGLIPRNLKPDQNYWNAQDAAADNYPFMVLTTFFTNRELFEGRMKDMLKSETQLTSALGRCPQTYYFDEAKNIQKVDTSNVIFGSAEYMKDGLLPITEWLGHSPWSERMLGILDDLGDIVDVVTEIEGTYWGNSQVVEVNGDLLQVLSRTYWMTGDKKYLNWAIMIGDHYLLDAKNDLSQIDRIRLRDHGGEIVLGLCELYATVHFALPEKKDIYKKPLYKLLDRILEVSRNEHGLFYDEVNLLNGEVIISDIADTWGYILDGYYTVYLLDDHEPYRKATLKVMNNLNDHYCNYNWERGNHDGYADAIESAINLYNREPIASVAEWIDSEMQVMFSMQKPSGVIGGWHGDGNFARTSIMYSLLNTCGSYVQPWDEGVKLGAIERTDSYVWVLESENDWSGKIYFDKPRHTTNLNLPFDWARINQFPEWFTPQEDEIYALNIATKSYKKSGRELWDGLDISLTENKKKIIILAK